MSLTRKAQLLPVPCGSPRCLWLLIDCMREAGQGCRCLCTTHRAGLPCPAPCHAHHGKAQQPTGQQEGAGMEDRDLLQVLMPAKVQGKTHRHGVCCTLLWAGSVCPGVHQQLGRPEELHRLPLAWLEPHCKRKIHW